MQTAKSAGALIGAVIISQLADKPGRRNMLFCAITGYALVFAAGSHGDGRGSLFTAAFVRRRLPETLDRG